MVETLITSDLLKIADKVGYAYPPNFTRDFKNHFGQTPSQYRRAIRIADIAKKQWILLRNFP